MKQWTLDQIILAPGGAKVDLEKRAQELEVLRKENADLRAGISKLIEGFDRTTIKRKLQSLLDQGGA